MLRNQERSRLGRLKRPERRWFSSKAREVDRILISQVLDFILWASYGTVLNGDMQEHTTVAQGQGRAE